MAKLQKVDPKGKEVLKHLDKIQKTARDRGQEPLPESVTRKMVDKVVKQA